MENESKRIIEINGVKLEVDLSTARRIDEFKVGDNVKVLMKEYNGYKVLPGVITEFVNFKERPAIVIAIFKEASYSTPPTIDFIYYTADSDKVEIAATCEHELKINRESMVSRFEDEIRKKHKEADEMQARLDYFNDHFNKYFNN